MIQNVGILIIVNVLMVLGLLSISGQSFPKVYLAVGVLACFVGLALVFKLESGLTQFWQVRHAQGSRTAGRSGCQRYCRDQEASRE